MDQEELEATVAKVDMVEAMVAIAMEVTAMAEEADMAMDLQLMATEADTAVVLQDQEVVLAALLMSEQSLLATLASMLESKISEMCSAGNVSTQSESECYKTRMASLRELHSSNLNRRMKLIGLADSTVLLWADLTEDFVLIPLQINHLAVDWNP